MPNYSEKLSLPEGLVKRVQRNCDFCDMFYEKKWLRARIGVVSRRRIADGAEIGEFKKSRVGLEPIVHPQTPTVAGFLTNSCCSYFVLAGMGRLHAAI